MFSLIKERADLNIYCGRTKIKQSSRLDAEDWAFNYSTLGAGMEGWRGPNGQIGGMPRALPKSGVMIGNFKPKVAHSYVMQSAPKANLKIKVGVGIDVPLGAIQITRKEKPGLRALYWVSGAGGGYGLGFSIFELWSSPNEFTSTAGGIECFGGTVAAKEWGASFGIGYSSSSWTWTQGPAKNTICDGDGPNIGIAAGITATSVSLLILCFDGIVGS